jgi:Flp pilus assembly protein CpaB
MQPSRLSRLLDGAPVALPPRLDRLSERWFAARPRTRAALLAGVAGLLLLVGATHLVASPFGPPQTVLLATRDLPVGHPLSPSDLRSTGWPRELVPTGALTARAAVEGRTVRAPLPEGAVATDRHLGDLGMADLLPGGRAGVPVSLDLLPALEPGTRLDLVGRDVHGQPIALAADALVIGDDGDAVWLAVAPDQAPGVAAAAAAGVLTTVVRAPGARRAGTP